MIVDPDCRYDIQKGSQDPFERFWREGAPHGEVRQL